MDVSKQFEEVVLFLDEEGLVSALEEMADAPMSGIEPLGIVGMQREHYPGQGRWPALQSEMDVIVHEAVGEDPKPKPFLALAEPFEIRFSVPIVAKDGLSLVPSSDHVVDPARELYAKSPGQAHLQATSLYLVLS
jgi:hypothetical protein